MSFTGFLLIALFAFQVVNKSVYTHSHKLANGIIVTHAHPFNKSDDSNPYKSHQHLQTDFIFFENLEILFLVLFTIVAAYEIAKESQSKIYSFPYSCSSLIASVKGRAPPAS